MNAEKEWGYEKSSLLNDLKYTLHNFKKVSDYHFDTINFILKLMSRISFH